MSLAGLRVPEDVAIVGFDDVSFAPLLSPALTTVRAPIEDVGRMAAEKLVAQIQGASGRHAYPVAHGVGDSPLMWLHLNEPLCAHKAFFVQLPGLFTLRFFVFLSVGFLFFFPNLSRGDKDA